MFLKLHTALYFDSVLSTPSCSRWCSLQHWLMIYLQLSALPDKFTTSFCLQLAVLSAEIQETFFFTRLWVREAFPNCAFSALNWGKTKLQKQSQEVVGDGHSGIFFQYLAEQKSSRAFIFLTWRAKGNISRVWWIYFTYPSGNESKFRSLEMGDQTRTVSLVSIQLKVGLNLY